MKKIYGLSLVAFVVSVCWSFAAFACPSSSSAMMDSKPKKMAKKAAKKDIVTTAISAGKFKTLVAAVKAAGLVKVLRSKGPFTVFAPTDKAFSKLPKGAIAKLLKNKKKLSSILTYHVVSGKVLASQVVKLKSAKTVQGQNVSIMVKKGQVMINGAKVLVTDIKCSNGVIHVISDVILPKVRTASAKPKKVSMK